MKFIHIADVHLGMIPDANYPWGEQRSKDIWNTFSNVINLCNTKKADILLISGDLFHRQPLVKELKEVNYLFSKLINTKVVLIAGNHDYIGENSNYRNFNWNENVYFLDSKEISSIYIESCNTRVYGLSYHQRDIFEEKYKDIYPDKSSKGVFNILVAHGGDIRNIPINNNNIRGLGFDYVALGHIHKHSFIGDRVAYSGSLEPLDITETGSHGYIYGELSDNKDLDVSFVPLSKSRYYSEIIETDVETTEGELQDIIKERVESIGKDNIYRFILEGIRETGISFDTREFLKLGKIIDIEDNTMPDYDFEALSIENRNNIIGMFIKEIRQSDAEDEVADKALYYGIEALMKAGGFYDN